MIWAQEEEYFVRIDTHLSKEQINKLKHGKEIDMNDLINRAYESAKSKGFHDKSQEVLKAIQFRDSKEYNSLVKYLNEVELTKDIALVITELAEAIEHVRKGGIVIDKQNWKESLPEELADAVIRIFDLCGKNNIDLPYFIEEKMAYNEGRPALHGKRF